MKQIKLFSPYINDLEENAIVKTLHSKFWASGAGIGQVKMFESRFRKYISSNKCIAVNSGTAALHLALSLFDVKNKEVIIPSLSFISTAHAVIYNGGIPIFADVDKKTLCIDPESIKKKITKKTRIILPVHFGGTACNMKEIMKISSNYNLIVVEDAAHAAGASFKKKKIGSHGTAVCFSFHPVKNLAMPSGGAITLNGKNTRNYDKILKSKRWCGIANRDGPKYDIKYLGWNYYMNEFSAAIGLEQLKKLDKMNEKRVIIAKKYEEEIDTDNKIPFNKDCSYHLYWILVKNRNSFIRKMKELGIETGIHYKPIHEMEFYSSKINLPVTDKIGKNIVTIPIHPDLSENDVGRIIQLTNKFARF